MKIEILICTCNERIEEVEKVLCEHHPQISYFISHQVFDGRDYGLQSNTIRTLLERQDVKYKRTNSKGLSKNRNHCLQHSSGDILIFADDDVQYDREKLLKLPSLFSENSELDGITFRISTKSSIPFKQYQNYDFVHNWRSIMKVSSIEIAIKRGFILKRRLCFDERFGLGSIYTSAEENIFLNDAISNGAKIKYIASDIVMHPPESSGKMWKGSGLVEAKGALFRRLYGKKGIFLLLIFAIKKWPEYKESFSFLKFCMVSISTFIKLEKK